MANYNITPRWSKEDCRILEKNLDKYNWKIDKLPVSLLADMFNRTEAAVIAKAKRLVLQYERTYEWSQDEQNGSFHYYLKGLPTKEIHEKLLAFGSQATLEQLESELSRMKKMYSDEIKDYAEERGLPVAKAIQIDTIDFFIKNKNTTSDFTRKALHSRIARG